MSNRTYRYIVRFKCGLRSWTREVAIEGLHPALAVAQAFDRVENECEETFWNLGRNDLTITVEKTA